MSKQIMPQPVPMSLDVTVVQDNEGNKMLMLQFSTLTGVFVGFLHPDAVEPTIELLKNALGEATSSGLVLPQNGLHIVEGKDGPI